MNASILLVDDDPPVRETLTYALEAEGYRVATAASGTEALTCLEEQDFDVIVSDVFLPDVNGLDVLAKSRSAHPGAAVILITGYPSLDDAIEALRRGASDYLEKPFPLDYLILSVERVVRRRTPLAETRLDPLMHLSDEHGSPAEASIHGGATAPAPAPSPTLRLPGLREAVKAFERSHVFAVLAQVRFDKREAADRLGISLASLYRKLQGGPPAG